MRKKKRNRGFKIVSKDKRIWADGELRKKCLTAEDLAAQITTDETISCEISHDTVTRFLNAKENIDKDKFTAIAKKLGKSPEWFLEPEAISTAPLKRVPYYVETKRNLQISELIEKLRQDTFSAVNLYGRGGLGKTELVLKLIRDDKNSARRQFAGGYCFVYLGAGSVAADIERFFQMVREKNCPYWEETPSENYSDVEKVQWYYRNYPLVEFPILVIFDNVTNYEDIEEYLPIENYKYLRVLVTSRRKALASSCCCDVPLHDFEEEDALELIRGVLKDEFFFNTYQTQLTRICRMVGYLPIALELIASSITTAAIGKKEYLQKIITQLEDDNGLAQVLCKVESGQVGYIDRLPKSTLRDELQDVGLQAIYTVVWNLYSDLAKQVAYAISQFPCIAVDVSFISKIFCFYKIEEEEEIKSILNNDLVRNSFLDVCCEGRVQYHNLTRNFVRGQEHLFADDKRFDIDIQSTRDWDLMNTFGQSSISFSKLIKFNVILFYHKRLGEITYEYLYGVVRSPLDEAAWLCYLAQLHYNSYVEFVDESDRGDCRAQQELYNYINKAVHILINERKRISEQITIADATSVESEGQEYINTPHYVDKELTDICYALLDKHLVALAMATCHYAESNIISRDSLLRHLKLAKLLVNARWVKELCAKNIQTSAAPSTKSFFYQAWFLMAEGKVDESIEMLSGYLNSKPSIYFNAREVVDTAWRLAIRERKVEEAIDKLVSYMRNIRYEKQNTKELKKLNPVEYEVISLGSMCSLVESIAKMYPSD